MIIVRRTDVFLSCSYNIDKSREKKRIKKRSKKTDFVSLPEIGVYVYQATLNRSAINQDCLLYSAPNNFTECCEFPIINLVPGPIDKARQMHCDLGGSFGGKIFDLPERAICSRIYLPKSALL